MKIGVMLPAAEVAGPGVTPGWATVRSFAVAAQERGLDSVWMFDHFFNETPAGDREGMHEAWTTLTAVAAVTTRIQVGTLVLCSPFRNLALTAKMAATLQEISSGRLVLGVGAGWHDPEFTAFGYPSANKVDRFAEALPIITALLRGERVSIEGRFHTMRDAVLVPPPEVRIPVLVAAEGPRMLRLAAHHADAWVTSWHGRPDDRLRGRLADLSRALDDADRDPASLERHVGIYVHDPDNAEPLDPDEPVVTGSVADLADALDAYAALGIDHLVVQPFPHTERTVDRLAAAMELRKG